MHAIRLTVLGVIAAGSLLLQPAIAPSVSADGSQRVSQTISFTQYSGADQPPPCSKDVTTDCAQPGEWWCVDLHNVTIYGTGTKTTVITEQTMPDGSTHREIETTVLGTAKDNVGASYRFDYHNHASVDISPGGSPVQVMLTDGYNLVGNAGANNLHTHFTANFTTPSADPESWVYTPEHVHGTPFNCDPI